MAKRLVSVVTLLPLVIFAAYWSVWTTSLATVLAIVLCMHEYNVALKQGGYGTRPVVGLIVALLPSGAAMLHADLPAHSTGATVSGIIMLALMSELLHVEREDHLADWALTFAGACYIGWLSSYFILLRSIQTPLHAGWLSFLPIPSGFAWVCVILAIPWCQDGAAYLVGRKIGHHRIAPLISPKKSWEGTIAGMLTAIGIALVLVPLFGLPIGYGEAVLLGVVGGIVGFFGDLVESLIKRRIGLKDMSNLVPGHGGILDRIDSILFAAPVLYYFVLLFT